MPQKCINACKVVNHCVGQERCGAQRRRIMCKTGQYMWLGCNGSLIDFCELAVQGHFNVHCKSYRVWGYRVCSFYDVHQNVLEQRSVVQTIKCCQRQWRAIEFLKFKIRALSLICPSIQYRLERVGFGKRSGLECVFDCVLSLSWGRHSTIRFYI